MISSNFQPLPSIYGSSVADVSLRENTELNTSTLHQDQQELQAVRKDCRRCQFTCFFDEMEAHMQEHTRLDALTPRKRENKHTEMPCPFGDYIS